MVDSQHWTDQQKSALVERILQGELTLQSACQRHSLSLGELKEWVEIYRRQAQQAFDDEVLSAFSSQGVSIDELSHAEFSGQLGDLAIAELIQNVEMGRKDATITVEHDDGAQSRIWCSGGNVIDAESLRLTGSEALYRLITLRDGVVRADFKKVHHVRTVKDTTQNLLMEAARRSDEGTRVRARIGDMQVVYGPSETVLSPGVDMPPEWINVLRLFDGRRTLEEVVMASDAGDLETLTIMEQLIGGSYLTPRPSATRPSLPRVAAPEIPDSQLPVLPMAASRRSPSMGAPRSLLLGGLASVATALGVLGFFVASGRLSANPSRTPAETTHAEAASTVEAPATLPPPEPCPDGMTLVAGGRFHMGSDSRHPLMRQARPAREVRVESFCMAVSEVTVEAYAECARSGACQAARQDVWLPDAPREDATDAESLEIHAHQCNAGRPGRERHPINCVTHAQASDYCAWRGAALPTGAQWELAARGTEGRRFPWGDEEPAPGRLNACGSECADWHRRVGLDSEIQGVMYDADDGYPGTAPVGSFEAGATPEGVMDLAGNVLEWTRDERQAVGAASRHDVPGESFEVRGGSFASGVSVFADPALRTGRQGGTHAHDIGFRCARSPIDSASRLGTTTLPTPGDGLVEREGESENAEASTN